MPHTRLRTWPHHHPETEDYVIRCEGMNIGRVYLADLPEGER